MCIHVCVLLTTVWFIPSFSGVAVWGPLCVMPMRRGLYVIEVGLWKPPAIWSPAALDVCLSIRQFLLIAQSQDSVPWLSIEWILHRLNTLICNKVWDLTNPWPWDWPDNAELVWEQVACGAKGSSLAVTSPILSLSSPFCILFTCPSFVFKSKHKNNMAQNNTSFTEMMLLKLCNQNKVTVDNINVVPVICCKVNPLCTVKL